MTAVIQAFKQVRLIGAQVQGFRGFMHPMVFDFQKGLNEFIGDNGKGKSSIGELVAWIVTGRNIEGKQKDLNITNKDSESVIGILIFEDENGNVHELERRQSSSMTLKLNYDTIPQKRLDELLPMDLFLCAFNPIYFLSMDATLARKTIANLFPVLPKVGVLAEMEQNEREALEKESFEADQTNEYLKNRTAELKQVDDDRKWLEGYIGKLKEKVVVPEPMVFDEAPLTRVQQQLDELNARKPLVKDIQAMLVKRQGFQANLAQVQHQSFDKQALKAELNQERALLTQQLKTETEKQYTPFSPLPIESKLQVLRNDYKHQLEASKSLEVQAKQLQSKPVHVKEGEQCPTCRQAISKETVKVLEKELAETVSKEKQDLEEKQTAKQKSLMDLEAEGKALLAEIKNAKQEDDKSRNLFEQNKQKAISAINSRLEQIEKELQVISVQEKEFETNKQSQIQALQKEIQALGVDTLEADNARIEREFKAEITAAKATLQAELDRLQKQKQEVSQHEGNRLALQKRADDQVKELEIRQKEMDGYQTKEEEIRSKVFYMKAFAAKKLTLLNQQIKKHLSLVEIHLQKIAESTGEVKDCFEIFYMGKELKICSTSETIRAGLEISNMVCKLSGVQFPVFVDNGESITTYDDPGFQTIEVRVVKDKPLTMIKDGKEIEIKPSAKKVVSSKPKTSPSRYPSRSANPAATVTTA